MIIGIEATKAFEREKTGVGWYTYYLIEEFRKIEREGVKLRLYVNPYSNVKCQMSNVKFLKWPLKYFWTQGRLSLEMIANPPDVLFIPAHLPPLIHPKKLVVTIHDLAFKQYPEVYSKKELRLQEWGIQRVLRKAWRIITPSEFTKSEIQKYYPRLAKNNIFVVPHGVELKTQNHNVKLKTNIVYIGRLEAKKNIVNLIKSFNILKKNYSLILIGPQGYGYRQIKKEILASPYKNYIQELGWLPHEEVAKHLANARLFVFPSLYEGFGLPLLESFAAGTPAVCSDIPALKEVGGDCALYFNPRDPEDMAEKMRAMIQNSALRSESIERGKTHAKLFSWQRTAEKTFVILKEGL